MPDEEEKLKTMRRTLLWWAAISLATAGAADAAAPSTPHQPRVLLVGTYHGIPGQYGTVQAAVGAARQGDWILVAPGDYKTSKSTAPAGAPDSPAGVLVQTPGIWIRGMDRNTVVIDGTRSGPPCSRRGGDQNGPLNGIMVWKANDVWVQNLTVCNFLAGTGNTGNEIWWNGGANSGRIGMRGYSGTYLTATSTYYGGESTAAQYGIFSSNAQGPSTWDQIYASNFNDSGMYVGACLQACDVTIDHAWMEYSALGYSGTNSGGTIVVENSQFDNNKDGLDTNTQINGDPPAPQNGACPGNGVSPITHTHSCWVFTHNYVHDNNNADVPQSGSAAAGPTGTGMTIAGGRSDTVVGNVFANNGAWGVIFVPYPDNNPPDLGQTCSGTGGVFLAGLGCIYDPENDALVHNTFRHNGFLGNPGNADFGQITISPGQPQNCFSRNTAPSGSAPPGLEQAQPHCGKLTTAPNTGGPLLAQVLCDTGFGACPAGSHYPQPTTVVMHRVPLNLPTMPNPCAGVPDNPWCSKGRQL
jgi:hypothetical protein